MEVPVVGHECSLLPFLKELATRRETVTTRLETVEHENAQLKKQVYGRRSERKKLSRAVASEPATPEQIQETRRARAEAKLEAPVMTTEHLVLDSQRRCTSVRQDGPLHADGPRQEPPVSA